MYDDDNSNSNNTTNNNSNNSINNTSNNNNNCINWNNYSSIPAVVGIVSNVIATTLAVGPIVEASFEFQTSGRSLYGSAKFREIVESELLGVEDTTFHPGEKLMQTLDDFGIFVVLWKYCYVMINRRLHKFGVEYLD